MLEKNNFIPLVNSIPKSGTNLLQKLLELLGYKYDKLGLAESLIMGKWYLIRQIIRGAIFDKNPVYIGFYAPVAISSNWLIRRLNRVKEGRYISGHVNYTERINHIFRQCNVKVIFIIRDPRDILVSHTHFLAKKRDFFLYPLFSKHSFEERILITLKGGHYREVNIYLNSFRAVLENALHWFSCDNCLVVKFEDLVGDKGGGDKNKQLRAIENIIKFLNINIDFNIEEIAEKLYGGTHTFRKGKIGSWKEELSDKLVKEVHKNIGDLITKLGYK